MSTRNAIALVLLSACGEPGVDLEPTPTGPVADMVTLAYQSRVDGEIEPCG